MCGEHMFFKMAAEYGRCNTPTCTGLLKNVFCQILDIPNLYFDTGIMTVGLLVSEIFFLYM